MQCPKCGLVVFTEMDLDPEFHTTNECEAIQNGEDETIEEES